MAAKKESATVERRADSSPGMRSRSASQDVAAVPNALAKSRNALADAVRELAGDINAFASRLHLGQLEAVGLDEEFLRVSHAAVELGGRLAGGGTPIENDFQSVADLFVVANRLAADLRLAAVVVTGALPEEQGADLERLAALIALDRRWGGRLDRSSSLYLAEDSSELGNESREGGRRSRYEHMLENADTPYGIEPHAPSHEDSVRKPFEGSAVEGAADVTGAPPSPPKGVGEDAATAGGSPDASSQGALNSSLPQEELRPRGPTESMDSQPHTHLRHIVLPAFDEALFDRIAAEYPAEVAELAHRRLMAHIAVSRGEEPSVAPSTPPRRRLREWPTPTFVDQVEEFIDKYYENNPYTMS